MSVVENQADVEPNSGNRNRNRSGMRRLGIVSRWLLGVLLFSAATSPGAAATGKHRGTCLGLDLVVGCGFSVGVLVGPFPAAAGQDRRLRRDGAGSRSGGGCFTGVRGDPADHRRRRTTVARTASPAWRK